MVMPTLQHVCENHISVVFPSSFGASSPLVRVGSFRVTFAFSHRREHVTDRVTGKSNDMQTARPRVVAHRLGGYTQMIRQFAGAEKGSFQARLVVEIVRKLFDFSQYLVHAVAGRCMKS